MSLARKQAIIASIVWFAVSVLFVVVFFTAGAESFTDPDHSGSRKLLAAIILPGYVLNVALLLWTRSARIKGETDERDDLVARKASEVTLTVLAVCVFVASLGLYEAYGESNAVPSGWLYLMAYGTMALISLVHPVATLAVDFGGKVDG